MYSLTAGAAIAARTKPVSGKNSVVSMRAKEHTSWTVRAGVGGCVQAEELDELCPEAKLGRRVVAVQQNSTFLFPTCSPRHDMVIGPCLFQRQEKIEKTKQTSTPRKCCAVLTCTARTTRKLRVFGCDVVGTFLNFYNVNPVEFFQHPRRDGRNDFPPKCDHVATVPDIQRGVWRTSVWICTLFQLDEVVPGC
jgi:hypothetical protein